MSNRCKLIVVEGIPGSGKTSTARFIQGLLDEAHVPNALYLEGDLNHPADYEGIAWMPWQELEDYLQQSGPLRALIEPYAWEEGEDGFIAYRKLERDHPENVPQEAIYFLAQRDVYEVSTAEQYCRLALKRWQAFTGLAARDEKTYVFECCLMQNPLAVLMLYQNMSENYVLRHIRSILEILEELDPVIVYLWQKDTWAAFDKIIRERPKEWIDFVIAYTERGAWGKANGLSGYESVVQFHDVRKKIEMRLLRELGSRALLIERIGDDWEQYRREVSRYIHAILTR